MAMLILPSRDAVRLLKLTPKGATTAEGIYGVCRFDEN